MQHWCYNHIVKTFWITASWATFHISHIRIYHFLHIFNVNSHATDPKSHYIVWHKKRYQTGARQAITSIKKWFLCNKGNNRSIQLRMAYHRRRIRVKVTIYDVGDKDIVRIHPPFFSLMISPHVYNSTLATWWANNFSWSMACYHNIGNVAWSHFKSVTHSWARLVASICTQITQLSKCDIV